MRGDGTGHARLTEQLGGSGYPVHPGTVVRPAVLEKRFPFQSSHGVTVSLRRWLRPGQSLSLPPTPAPHRSSQGARPRSPNALPPGVVAPRSRRTE